MHTIKKWQVETVKHFLFECRKFSSQRIYLQNFCRTNLNCLDPPLHLLVSSHEESEYLRSSYSVSRSASGVTRRIIQDVIHSANWTISFRRAVTVGIALCYQRPFSLCAADKKMKFFVLTMNFIWISEILISCELGTCCWSRDRGHWLRRRANWSSGWRTRGW